MKSIVLFAFISLLALLYYYGKYHRKRPGRLGGGAWFRKKLDPGYETVLKKYSRYYRSLPDKLKANFGDRVMRFIQAKEFIGKGKLEMTDLMRVLIAESAVKLTFGHRTYLFEKFEKILVFKEEFYSDWSHSREIGETNPRGVIVFSWKDFLQGDLIEDDNLNVGLHEFAHALMNQTISAGRYEDKYFISWVDLFFDFHNDESKMKYIRDHELFRKYAFHDEMEFFAVAAEHFFETPSDFKRGLPELYDIMCKMLNQDPSSLYKNGVETEIKPAGLTGNKERQDFDAPDQPPPG